MGVTIREVAKAAGVSVTTVSRAYNQDHLVNAETRARILDVAAHLRYVPNATARNLSIRHTHVLGLLVPQPASEYFIELMRGMDEAAQRLGYLLLISGSHNRIENARTAFRSMTGQVDGLMIVAPDVGPEALHDVLPEDVPVVFVNSPALAGHYDTIHPRNRVGASLAVRHLLSLGHRRIAYVHGPEHNAEAQDRREGYRATLREAGIEPDPALEFPGAFVQESGVEAGRAILELADRPTAVFACNDLMAIGLLTVFHGAGLRVPEDVAVIGFDDIPMARFVQPALSTVRTPIREMGARTAERLVAAIEGREAGQVTTDELETTLVPRASTLGTGPPGAARPHPS